MKQLDPSKLTSVDENGDRLNIIPAEVRGKFRKYRNYVQGVLLAVFMLLPWTTMNGRQTIWLNVPDREFALFGALFKAHDAPMMFFILAIVTLGLAFVTSIWGRVWCGWACPQTVFIEAVFRRIEQWTEGNYIERRKLRESFSPERLRKSGLKWVLFFLASSIIAHSFLAYFVGAQELLGMMQDSPFQNLTYFLLVTIFTALILFDFAWFREQFCVIMCPYGRIQSLLLDSKSLAVVYDVKRGEPRRGLATPSQPAGDCVSCNRCVQACPTGIDIRNGLQMECIACTACIDACDEIMEKVNKPKGLIRYNTLDGSKLNLKRPRSLIYMALILIMVAGLTYSLASRESLDWTVIRGQGLPYSFVKSETGTDLILNQFKIHIQNQGQTEALYKLSLSDEATAQGLVLNVGENPLPLKAGEGREWYFFIKAPPTLLTSAQGKLKVTLQVHDIKSTPQVVSTKDIVLVGPKE